MRLNKFIAHATGGSRRQADYLIEGGRVVVDGQKANFQTTISDASDVRIDGGERLVLQTLTYVVVNKPIGYVSSRKQQDEKPTIFNLLPEDMQPLKVAGRLDADSRGLVLLTNDGDFAHKTMHPSFEKSKVYQLKLDREITDEDLLKLNTGVELEDGLSALETTREADHLRVTMHEGRNRQIRRTLSALGYEVTDLYRTALGPYDVGSMQPGEYEVVEKREL